MSSLVVRACSAHELIIIMGLEFVLSQKMVNYYLLKDFYFLRLVCLLRKYLGAALNTDVTTVMEEPTLHQWNQMVCVFTVFRILVLSCACHYNFFVIIYRPDFVAELS